MTQFGKHCFCLKHWIALKQAEFWKSKIGFFFKSERTSVDPKMATLKKTVGTPKIFSDENLMN